MLLWFFDLISLVLIGVRVVRHYNLFGIGRRGFDPNNTMGVNNHFPIVFPLDKRASALAAFVLFVRLKTGHIRPLWIMVPLWIFLFIAIVELTRRLISIHNKATAVVSR
uniref:Undecaprenyl/decaprenyl-phosphate alpha-N-acetylglucosaminyl 1-phosphate transferase n=1 Tax=Ascaris lumbricoides TaxID=6252 RepID=A0A0M3HY42_ASCLU